MISGTTNMERRTRVGEVHKGEVVHVVGGRNDFIQSGDGVKLVSCGSVTFIASEEPEASIDIIV